MADGPFTGYSFYAAGSSTALSPRTMPDRLLDVINVKDWGATGDGVTDDTDAINAAIDKAITLGLPGGSPRLGAVIYFPPGIYIIGKVGTTQLFLDRPSGGGILSYMGAGRDVSILRGNYSTGGQMHGSGVSVTNVVSGTGGVDRVTLSGFVSLLSNGQTVWISGVTGVNANINGQHTISALNAGSNWIELAGTVFAGAYTGGGTVIASVNGGFPPNGMLVLCNFPASQVLWLSDLAIENLSTDASSGAFMSQSGSVQAIGCRFKGVIGYYSQVIGFGGRVADCVFECSRVTADAEFTFSEFVNVNSEMNGSVGCFFGQGTIQNCVATGFDVGFAFVGPGTVFSCKASQCGVGFFVGYIGGDTEGGGNTGGAGGLNQNPSPPVLLGASALIMSANWADGCDYGMYVKSQNSFFSGNVITGTLGPGGNPIQCGIYLETTSRTTFISNTLPVTASAAVQMIDVGWFTGNNYMGATKGPSGWSFPAADAQTPGGWKFEQCGDSSAVFPRTITFAELPPVPDGGLPPPQEHLPKPMEGAEFYVSNCETKTDFADIVSASSSPGNHYKLRWDGSNWRRTG